MSRKRLLAGVTVLSFILCPLGIAELIRSFLCTDYLAWGGPLHALPVGEPNRNETDPVDWTPGKYFIHWDIAFGSGDVYIRRRYEASYSTFFFANTPRGFQYEHDGRSSIFGLDGFSAFYPKEFTLAMYWHYVWDVSFPLWCLVIPTAILPIRWFIVYFQNRLKAKPGFCKTCGYDLRATPNQCPECGTIALTQIGNPGSPSNEIARIRITSRTKLVVVGWAAVFEMAIYYFTAMIPPFISVALCSLIILKWLILIAAILVVSWPPVARENKLLQQ